MASIRQSQNGRWQVQVRRRGIVPVAKTFPAKQDAERWARQVESEMDRGVFLDRTEAERTTLAELIDRYIREITPKKKSASKETRRLKALREHFGAYSAAGLRNLHIAAYRDQRIRDGAAGATVVKDLNSLTHVLEVAIKDWGLPLAANPARLVRRPSVAQGRDRRLLPGEQEKLIEACRRSRSPMLRAAVLFALETGMRLGEIVALDWRHVDLSRRVARLPDTKNGTSRDVPLSSAAVAVIAALPRRIGDTRVFWAWNRSDSFEGCWRRALDAAGIQGLRFHDLRHEATSRFFERGLSLPEVAAITGHKTWQMLRRYTHLNASDLATRLG